jgi:hypothetical protein
MRYRVTTKWNGRGLGENSSGFGYYVAKYREPVTLPRLAFLERDSEFGRRRSLFRDAIRVPRLKNVHIPAADLIAPTSLSTRNIMEAAHGAATVHVAHGWTHLRPLMTQLGHWAAPQSLVPERTSGRFHSQMTHHWFWPPHHRLFSALKCYQLAPPLPIIAW